MRNFLIYFVLVFHLSAFAGGGGVEVSGGGHAVMKDGQLQLLDLVEAGILNPTIEPTNMEPNQFVISELQKGSAKVFLVNDGVLTAFASQLTKIWKKDPLFAVSIYKTIHLYQWVLINEPLKPVEVKDSVVRSEFLQLALRKGRIIYVNRLGWDRLSIGSQVALILHEAILGLSESDCPESRARQVVGLLFSDRFQDLRESEFQNYLGQCLPNISSVRTRFQQDHPDLISDSFQYPVSTQYNPKSGLDAFFLPNVVLAPPDGSSENVGIFLMKFESDLEKIKRACLAEQRAMPPGTYGLLFEAQQIVVTFADSLNEGELNPKVIWQLSERNLNFKGQSYLKDRMVEGSCWDQSSNEFITSLSDFWK